MTGDDLKDFVDHKLFPYLKKFKTDALSPDQLNLERNLGKTNPLNENDLAEFVKLQKTKADSDNSWSLKIAAVDTGTWDLSVKNPNRKNETVLRDPKVIIDEMKELDKEAAEILKTIRGIV